MRWTRYFRRNQWDEERARELETYLEIETDENIARKPMQAVVVITHTIAVRICFGNQIAMEKVDWVFAFACAAYNLVRMRNLVIQPV